MVNKKTKIVKLIMLSLILLIVINTAISFAYFNDKTEKNKKLQFGTVKISANPDGWFSNTENFYAQIKPGDKILQENIAFNLASGSQSMFIRVKYSVSSDTTNSEALKVYNYLKNWNLTLSSSTDYTWSAKRGDYYYLMDSTGANPLVVSTVRNTDYTFLTVDNSQVPYELNYDGETANVDPISISISVEAIQTANVTATLANVENAFNSAMANN